MTACGEFPKDPDRTWERVKNSGTLRVGVIEEEPWAYLTESNTFAGIEVGIARDFAASLGVEPKWSVVSEAQGAARLERQELDLLVGGLTADSPRKKTLALTRPYLKTRSESEGKRKEHVLAVPKGENRFLTTLETFLTKHQAKIEDYYRAEGIP